MDWHRGNETSCFADTGNYTTELVVPEAVAFLQRKAKEPDTPFFLYLPFHLIHEPSQVPQHFVELYPELDPRRSARSQGMCGVCECKGEGDRTAGLWDLQPQNSRDATWGECRTVLGMAAALDWAVGSVVDALKASGQWNDTVIFYTSDNVNLRRRYGLVYFGI